MGWVKFGLRLEDSIIEEFHYVVSLNLSSCVFVLMEIEGQDGEVARGTTGVYNIYSEQ